MAVQQGELVVLPTDTVYGIAADAFDPDAVGLAAGGQGPRPGDAAAGAGEHRDHARRPGLRGAGLRPRAHRGVLARAADRWCAAQQTSLQWDLGDTRGTVAVRMPDHELTREILDRTGPLAVSSANLTGSPAATDADQAEEMLRRRGRRDRRRRRRRRAGGPPPSSTPPATRAGCCAAARCRWRQLNDVLEPLGATLTDDEVGEDVGVREYLVVFLVAAAVTYLLTVVAREIAIRTGAVARVRDRDVHAEPIPYLGGIAMLGGLVAAYLVARELPPARHQPAVRLRGRAGGHRRGGADLRRRRARRHLRPRRAHQVRRPGAGRGAARRTPASSTATSSPRRRRGLRARREPGARC